MHKKYRYKLYMLCSALLYVNKKYENTKTAYSQKDLHKLLNNNLEQSGCKPIAIRTLQSLLSKLQQIGVTTNYCKRLGNNKVRARGSISYYYVNYQNLKQCKQKIYNYYNLLINNNKYEILNTNFIKKQNSVSNSASPINKKHNNKYISTYKKVYLKEKVNVTINETNKELIKNWCKNDDKIMKYAINNIKDITNEVMKAGIKEEVAIQTCVSQIAKTNPNKIRFLSRYFYERKYANDYEKFSKEIITICKDKESQQNVMNKYSKEARASDEYIASCIYENIFSKFYFDFQDNDIYYKDEDINNFAKQFNGLTRKQVNDTIDIITKQFITNIKEGNNVNRYKKRA